MNHRITTLLTALLCLPAVCLADQPSRSEIDLIRSKADDEIGEIDGKLMLSFFDALTGAPIPGASVTFEGETGTTGADGKVAFPFPQVDGSDVILKARFRKSGYIPSDVPVRVLVHTVFIKRFSISPGLTAEKLRIVLDWGSRPPDLDQHLVKRGRYHISYRDMRKVEDQAWLDRDDTDGEGPETITVKRIDDTAVYTFFVHDYTNRDRPGAGGLSESRAQVLVYGDDRLLHHFQMPGGPGRYWKVFDIRDGQIVPDSRMLDAAP